jgi:DNA polymerase (family 10)
VDVLGHATGRLLLKRDPVRLDVAQVIASAKRNRVVIEINSQPHRLDFNDAHARVAREHGVRLAINSDAHSVAELRNVEWGVRTARRAWAAASDVMNTLHLADLRSALRRHGGA